MFLSGKVDRSSWFQQKSNLKQEKSAWRQEGRIFLLKQTSGWFFVQMDCFLSFYVLSLSETIKTMYGFGLPNFLKPGSLEGEDVDDD